MSAEKSHRLESESLEYQLALKNRALSSSDEGITISDCRLPDNPLIYANEGFSRLTGYAVQDAVGRNCRFLQGSETDPSAVEEIRAAISEERSCTVELLNYRKDGTPFWNRLSITPVRDERGITTHFVGVQSDVTTRRLAEDKLRVAHRRMKRDLVAAAAIQQTLLPQSLPDIEGADFAWLVHPCDELAGDSLNVIALNDRYVAIYILDVSGHGVPAALLSVSLNRTLSPSSPQSCLFTERGVFSRSAQVATPAQVIQALNSAFQIDSRTSQFFTMQYGILDTRTNEIQFASAGHPPPILARKNERPTPLEGGGLPVGVMEETEYPERAIQLRPGDRLLLYTDGVIEAENSNGEQFGIERLIDAIDRAKSDLLETALNSVWAGVRSWTQETALADDASMLAIGV